MRARAASIAPRAVRERAHGPSSRRAARYRSIRVGSSAHELPFGDTAGAVCVFSPNLRVTTGDNDLVLGVSDGQTPIRVEPGEICGLVGANGSGKSTLVRVLSGARGASAGSATVGTRLVGVLEQTAVSGSEKTVEEEAMSRMTHVREAERAMREALDDMERGESGAAGRLAEANARWDAVGGATAAKRVSTVLRGLGFSDDMARAPCNTLSGGWQMRVALARLLLSPAGDSRERGVNGGLLLLDEPSNHLDAKAKSWLANWIKEYAGTVVLVSHDEELLSCVNRVVELRSRKLHNFKGDYARFLREREARRAVAVASLERESAKAAKLDNFITKFGAKATKASAAKSKAKALEKVSAKMEEYAELAGEGELGDGPGDARKVILKLPKPPAGAREIIKTKNLAVGYVATNSTLVSDVNLTVTKGDRILILGPNGAGKSTLMKTMGGVIAPRGGEVELGEGAVIGYFSQDLAQELPTEVDALTHVLDVARKIDKTVTSETARSVLGALGITGSAAVDRTIGSLSGGEKARVALAAFVLRPVNVLLLDEASNHLDGTAIEALCEGLRGWEGAVCAITHNSSFAAALNPTIVVKVENGAASSAMHVAGAALGVGEYAEAKAAKMEDTFKKEEDEAKKKRRALEKEAANAPKIIEKIERALAVLDRDVEDLDARLLAAGADVHTALELQKQKDEKLAKQELYYAEWERLERVVAEFRALAEV